MKSLEEYPITANSPSERLTMQWFESATDFESFIDKIIDEADKSSTSESSDLPTLFDHLNPCPLETTADFRDLRGIVSHAFLSMFDGMPEDHVIILPKLNHEFLSRCRLLGAETSDYALNKTLLNVRKAGWHAGIQRTRPSPIERRTLDQIGYSAEIAARLVQCHAQSIDPHQQTITIDQMMCDPDLRMLFDSFAAELVPGYSLYEYRLAAFNFRKTGRASTYRLASDDYNVLDWELTAPLASLDPHDVPHKPGLYLIREGNKPLFWSSTLDLHGRVLEHVSYAEGRTFLPQSIEGVHGKLNIRILSQPTGWSDRKTEAVVVANKNQNQTPYNLMSAI